MTLEIVAGASGLLGLWMLVSGIRRMGHGHLWRGCRRCTGAVLLLGVASLAFLAAAHLYTYARLTAEGVVADISFTSVGPQRYQASLVLLDGTALTYDLLGDEWQLDARILKWEPQANLLGFDTLYRLERLSGRYREVAQEQSAPRSVYDLAGSRGIDLWAIAHDHPSWLPGIDAQYGSATYLPMREGARYQVTVSTTGLLARPADPRTRAMLEEGW